MIVVDSSVWIASFRGLMLPCVEALDAIWDTDEIVVGDVVLLELLKGARNEADAKRIERMMLKFKIEEMLNAQMAIAAAAYHRLLRSRGVTIRKTIDLIIATFCIENGHELLHHDRDFVPFATHLGLKTV